MHLPLSRRSSRVCRRPKGRRPTDRQSRLTMLMEPGFRAIDPAQPVELGPDRRPAGSKARGSGYHRPRDEARRAGVLESRRAHRVHAQLRILDLLPASLPASPALTPFLKWPGGKSQELAAIAAAAPPLTGRFIDPFVGGGSVLLAIPEEIDAWANDAAEDLIELYRGAAEERWSFRHAVEGVAQAWDALRSFDGVYRALADDFLSGSSGPGVVSSGRVRALSPVLALAGPGLEDAFAARLTKDLPSKFERMRKIQLALGRKLSEADLLANVEGAVRASFYLTIRDRYNRARLAGHLGRVAAGRLLLPARVRVRVDVPLQHARRVQRPVRRGDLQPQVDAGQGRAGHGAGDARSGWRRPNGTSATSSPSSTRCTRRATTSCSSTRRTTRSSATTTTAPSPWHDQQRLEAALRRLHCPVMVVIKDSAGIRGLYEHAHWRIAEAGKTYMWTIKSRNDRSAVAPDHHQLLTGGRLRLGGGRRFEAVELARPHERHPVGCARCPTPRRRRRRGSVTPHARPPTALPGGPAAPQGHERPYATLTASRGLRRRGGSRAPLRVRLPRCCRCERARSGRPDR